MSEDKSGKCSKCKNFVDYICQSGRCVPCEREELGEDGVEMLAVIFDLTHEGKKPIMKKDALNEHVKRKKIKEAGFKK